jgi:putative transcriptional regulator
MSSKPDIKPGSILISKPLIGDGFFDQSVVYITEHNDQGSLGFTLNKSSSLYLQDFIDGIEGKDRLGHGGPVEQDGLFYLHTFDTLKQTQSAGGTIHLGGDFEHLKEILMEARKAGFTDFQCRFFLGYSGWAPGQLDQEIQQDTWIVRQQGEIEDPLRLSDSAWKNQMTELGGEFPLWANAPSDPLLN